MNYIKRHVEGVANKINDTFKCVLITGARQTGKSTLIKRIFNEKRYVSFDDPFAEEQAKDSPNVFMSLNGPPVIYDEVQRVPGLFRYIKLACDNSDDRGLFCLSGSQPMELMKDASESLTGRTGIIELNGLSLREILNDPFNRPFIPTLEYVKAREKTVSAPDNIWKIIHRGSYPELQNGDVDWSQFYSAYVSTYLERDVRQLSAVHDLGDFRRFMVACAARTGQVLNYSNIADEIQRDADTVKKWISVLVASGIVYLLEPYTSSHLKRAIKTPKLYFRDTGLAAYLTRWLTYETLANGAMNGAFFETFVVSEILKSYANAGIDHKFCVSYYRGKDRKKVFKDGTEQSVESEIDLIIEGNGILYPIEIKQSYNVSADKTAAFTVLDQIAEKKRGTGAVICMCPRPGCVSDDILQLPVWYI